MVRISNGDADLFYLQKNFKKRELLSQERSLNKTVLFCRKERFSCRLGVFLSEKKWYTILNWKKKTTV